MPDWNRMSPSIPVIFLFYQDTWTASAEDAAERTSVLRTRGVYKGRPITLDHAKIIDLHKKGNGATAIAKAIGCSRGAVYKVLGLNGQ
jgi:DNA invertase Pin-like site-specific DNA recombinase